MSIQEWFRDNRRQALLALAAPAAWIGFEAAFGQLSWLDLVVGAFLFVCFAWTARPKPPKDSDNGIYGS